MLPIIYFYFYSRETNHCHHLTKRQCFIAAVDIARSKPFPILPKFHNFVLFGKKHIVIFVLGVKIMFMRYDNDIMRSNGKISSEALKLLCENKQFSAKANNLKDNYLKSISEEMYPKDSKPKITFSLSLLSMES
jgi:hypothetical protein